MNLVTGESQMEKPDEDEEEEEEEQEDGDGTGGERKDERDEKTMPADEIDVGGGDWDSQFKNGDRGENETLILLEFLVPSALMPSFF